MNPIALTLSIIAVAMVCFMWEKVSADVVAIGVLLALVFGGLLPAERAFAGFASDTVIMILGLLILTAALQRTGVVDIVGRAVLRCAGDNPNRVLLAIMITTAALSAFMSNTAAAAFFVPIAFEVASKASISPSRYLMPVAFAAILTSPVTLISTSSNLVVSGMMAQYQMRPLSMFELTPVGLVISALGLLYMFYVGRRLIPERAPATQKVDESRGYVSEIVVQPSSSLVGKKLADAKLSLTFGLNVLRIVRSDGRHILPRRTTVLKEGDLILVEASQEDILKIKDTAGVEIKADVKLSDPEIENDRMVVVEAIVLPGSPLIGSTLKGHGFNERYDLQVLGLNRRGVSIPRKISQVRLLLGDVLLLQGPRERIAQMQGSAAFQVFGPVTGMAEVRPRRRHAGLAIGIFAVAIALAALELTTVPVAMMLGAFLVFVTRCITPEEAYDAVDWKVIFLVGSMIGLGTAMELTGTAAWLASSIAPLGERLDPIWLLGGFFVLTILLTQPMSNQAAAIVLLPVAIQTARQMNLDPRGFAVMIAVGASCSYITPLEPACLLVYGPGRYRFRDFIKVGMLLTVIVFAVAMIMVPRLWPVQ